MLSSNSSSCCNHNNPNYTPFSENDITSFSSSKSQQDPNNNNFFFPFPNSPHMHFEYDDDYLHFLDHAEDLHSITNMAADWDDKITPSCSIGAGNPNSTMAEHCRPSVAVRSSKKDRHSKIDTARGPRDRRMRLSLDIARKFFDLQDMLGYDKASRTVDWLLRNSSSAIRDLARGRDGLVEHSSLALAESCTSEDCGEAVSSSATDKVTAAVAEEEGKNKCGRKRKRGVGGGGGGVQQKRATVGRESRRKARDRARERTSQKRRLMRERESATAAAAGTTHNFPIYDALSLRSEEARIISGATAEEILCHFHFHDTNTEILQQGEKIAAEIEFNIGNWQAMGSLQQL